MTARTVAGNVVGWLRDEASPEEKAPALARQPSSVRRVIAQAAGMWLATRLAYLLITLLARTYGFAPATPTALGVFPATPKYAPILLPLLVPYPFLANWVHWDASWYLLIGVRGYDIFTPDSTGFFPLYPLLAHLLALPLGPEATLPVALLLSNLASLAAFIGLGLLAAREERHTERAEGAPARLIMVTAAYPFAFFLFATYAESLLLACVVFSFLFARQGHWGWAAACAFFAGLTRPTAIALVPALAWEYGRQHGFWRRETWRHGAWRSAARLRELAGGLVVVVATPLGMGIYLLFLKLRYGNALTPFTAQLLYHGRKFWPIWQTLGEYIWRFTHPEAWSVPTARLYLDGGLLFLFLVITLLNIHRLPLLYTLYMLATFYILLGSPAPHRMELIPSMGRYLLMATPVFLLFSRWIKGRPWLETLLVGGGFMLQGLFVVLFLNGVWIE